MPLSGVRTPPDPSAYPAPARFSAGANISIAERYVHDGEGTTPLRGVIDGLIHWGGFEGLTLVTGADYDGSREEPWRRRETRLVKDDFDRAIRMTLGEFTPLAAGFQGSGRIVGFGIERAYSTVRPFQNIRPTGRQEFTLDRDSAVDVVINGLTTQTLRLAPGRYSVSDFPFATGANQVQLVVNDATGRNEIAVFDVFSGADLLGRGVVDFGLGLGQYEGSGSFEYDGPVLATGYVRKGVSDSLTLGLNAQASADSQQLGAEGVWGSRFGLVLVELAASRDRLMGRYGGAASVSYRHTFSLRERDDLRITATAETTSEYFEDVFQPGITNPDVWRASALIQWNAPWELGLSLGLGVAESRLDNAQRRQVDLGVSRSFGRANLVSNISFISGARDDDEDDVRVSVGLTVPLGGRWTSQARYDSNDNRAEAIISRYATGELGDISGEARLTNDDRNRFLSGRVDYINNRFEAQLTHNRQYERLEGGRSSIESNIAVSTFIGYAGGSVGIGRPTDDAFIIAPVHKSLAGSEVTLMSGSQKVARSGLFGPPVVPIRRAYGVNSFDIVVEPLPPGYDIGSGTLNVFPSFGAGYRMQIGSDASRIAVGSLVGPDGPLPLVTGLIAGPGDSAAEPRPFFTNRAGRFVADRLAPGDYRVLIDGAEVARFTIPEASEGVVNVGVLQIPSR
jgi:outer membrane usher protein